MNLDLPPEERWSQVATDYKFEIPILVSEIKKMLPPEVIAAVTLLGDEIENHIPYPYDMEIVGLAIKFGVHVGEVVLGNILYEVTAYNHSAKSNGSKACTSIVAEALDGIIYHGRNLDYSFLTDALRNMTIIVDFQRDGETVYTGTTFAGYVGLLSGQKPNGFTVTLDERDQGKWWMNFIEVLLSGAGGIAGFVIRDAIADPDADFEKAVLDLAYAPLIAPCYIIVGGVGLEEGAVITRDRAAAVDIWRLNTIEGRWFLVETNYDHWEPPPADDDRRDPANKAMNGTGRANLNGSSLFTVLSTPPVLNDGTTYTLIMSAAMPDLYNTWVRQPSNN